LTLGLLLVWRLGTHIPLPDMNQASMLQLMQKAPSSFLAVFDIYTGGALGRLSIFSLSVAPYILAANLVRVLTSDSKTQVILREGGEMSKAVIRQFDRHVFWLTATIAYILGFWLAVSLESATNAVTPVVRSPGLLFRLWTATLLTVGALIVMWIDSQIRRRGVQCDISVITYCGIITQFPTALSNALNVSGSSGRAGFQLASIILIAISTIAIIVFFERAQRRLLIQCPTRQIGHLPFKLISGGVISLHSATQALWLMFGALKLVADYGPDWVPTVNAYYCSESCAYFMVYIALIVFLGFFNTAAMCNPQETADQLRKLPAFLPGRRPGAQTAEYLDYVLTRITVVGVIYLAIIGVVPDLLLYTYNGASLFFVGLAVLIVVSGTMDIVSRMQGDLLTYQYKGPIK